MVRVTLMNKNQSPNRSVNKGWIALDIDGTITVEKHRIPERVVAYLRSLCEDGWRIALATGRSFSFAYQPLGQFDFPYLLLPQNGSIVLQMPEAHVLFRRYMSSKILPIVDQAFEGFDTDYLVYAGYEKGDVCYWRPSRFCEEDLVYLRDLQSREKKSWQAVDQFDPVILEPFPLIKCFGPSPRMKIIAERLRQTCLFEVSKIRDPFHEVYSLLLVTDQRATKGASLQQALDLLGRGEIVIAAGDDANDASLLQSADIKIAMSHAPEPLKAMADLIAPPTAEEGIIYALRLALNERK